MGGLWKQECKKNGGGNKWRKKAADGEKAAYSQKCHEITAGSAQQYVNKHYRFIKEATRKNTDFTIKRKEMPTRS